MNLNRLQTGRGGAVLIKNDAAFTTQEEQATNQMTMRGGQGHSKLQVDKIKGLSN